MPDHSSSAPALSGVSVLEDEEDPKFAGAACWILGCRDAFLMTSMRMMSSVRSEITSIFCCISSSVIQGCSAARKSSTTFFNVRHARSSSAMALGKRVCCTSWRSCRVFTSTSLPPSDKSAMLETGKSSGEVGHCQHRHDEMTAATKQELQTHSVYRTQVK